MADDITWATWQFTAESAEALPAGVSNVSSFLDLTQVRFLLALVFCIYIYRLVDFCGVCASVKTIHPPPTTLNPPQPPNKTSSSAPAPAAGSPRGTSRTTATCRAGPWTALAAGTRSPPACGAWAFLPASSSLRMRGSTSRVRLWSGLCGVVWGDGGRGYGVGGAASPPVHVLAWLGSSTSPPRPLTDKRTLPCTIYTTAALLDRFPKTSGLVPKASLGGPVNALHILVLRCVRG